MKSLKVSTLILYFSFVVNLYAQDCPAPTALISFETNQVRSTLKQGGTIWTDGDKAGFAIPNRRSLNSMFMLFLLEIYG